MQRLRDELGGSVAGKAVRFALTVVKLQTDSRTTTNTIDTLITQNFQNQTVRTQGIFKEND